jgi:hypothetical protein
MTGPIEPRCLACGKPVPDRWCSDKCRAQHEDESGYDRAPDPHEAPRHRYLTAAECDARADGALARSDELERWGKVSAATAERAEARRWRQAADYAREVAES